MNYIGGRGIHGALNRGYHASRGLFASASAHLLLLFYLSSFKFHSILFGVLQCALCTRFVLFRLCWGCWLGNIRIRSWLIVWWPPSLCCSIQGLRWRSWSKRARKHQSMPCSPGEVCAWLYHQSYINSLALSLGIRAHMRWVHDGFIQL